MAIQLKISINKGSTVTFSPNPLAASVLDQIFWVNNDPSDAHWPGLKKSDGTTDPNFFMTNQIAPGGGTSPSFSGSVPQSYSYYCSLHPESPSENGTINIT
jgi:plastocyanin